MKKIGIIGKTLLTLEAILLGLTIGCKDGENNPAPQTAKSTTQIAYPNFLSETEKRRYYVELADDWIEINLDKNKRLADLLVNIPLKTERICINNYVKKERIYFEKKENINELIQFANLLYEHTEEYKNGHFDVPNEFILSWLNFMKYKSEQKDELSYKREINFILGTKTISEYLDNKENLFLNNNEKEIQKFIGKFWNGPYKTDTKRTIKAETKTKIEDSKYGETYLIKDELGYVSVRTYEDGNKTIFCRSNHCKKENEFTFDKETTEGLIKRIEQRKKETEHIKETTDYWKFNSGSAYEILLENKN